MSSERFNVIIAHFSLYTFFRWKLFFSEETFRFLLRATLSALALFFFSLHTGFMLPLI
jgi:hypothetical protein